MKTQSLTTEQRQALVEVIVCIATAVDECHLWDIVRTARTVAKVEQERGDVTNS